MAKFQYGGQALIEGVLMRGKTALAVALRHPDGSIVYATERLDMGLRARRAMKLPFMRGLVVLYDTLVTGTRWLVRSATLQAEAELAAEEAAAAEKKARKEAEKAARVAKKSAGGGGAPGSLLGLLLLAGAPFVPACAAYSNPDAGSPGGSEPAPAADPSLGKGWQVAVGGMLLMALALGIGLFFLLPLLLAQVAVGQDRGLGFQLTEGLIRVVIFIVYLLLIAQAADVRRTFQYHGAEHQAIHTLEAGQPLTSELARTHPTAHPRCGTEFLVVVLLISILVFALVGSGPWWWLIGTRVLLIPIIAAVSYEVLQFGARHRRRRLVRWLWSPGIWVQAITTRQPTPDMNEVAIVSLQKALVADGNEIPEGSTDFSARPLRPEDLAAPQAAP